jgi:hypothetical protein
MVGSPTERNLFDPNMGSVLGLSWGASIADFLDDFPTAQLKRDSGDIHSYILYNPPVEMDMELTLTFLFHLNGLMSVVLQPFDLPAETSMRRQFLELGERLTAMFTGPPSVQDEGYYELDDGTTRIAFDCLDLRVRLEDCRQ